MESQIALSCELKNSFALFDLQQSEINNPSKETLFALQNSFENNKIVIIEGLRPQNLETFLDWPSVDFDFWVPPLEDHEILTSPINENHSMWSFYPNAAEIQRFQQALLPFQDSWEALQKNLFPNYKYQKRYWSWRFNSMDLGYLHLDVPSIYSEHQMRSFMNLSRRPRIIEIGPTFEDLVHKFYESEKLWLLKSLNATEYLQEIKNILFKKLKFEDHYLPRHFLRLAPGAIWISHSSLITHGLVYGEKTVCLETRIPTENISDQNLTFQSIFERAKINNINNSQNFSLAKGKYDLNPEIAFDPFS